MVPGPCLEVFDMSRGRTWLVIAVLAVPTVGQDAAGDARKAYEALKAEFTAAREAYSDALQEVSATEEYRKLRERYRDPELGDEGRKEIRNKLMALRSSVPSVDVKAFTERFKKAAEKYAGTAGAVPFLTWICRRGAGEEARLKAMETITASHPESAKLQGFTEFLSHASRSIPAERVREAATIIIEKNPDPEIRAAALYARAQTYLGKGRPRKPLAGFEEAYEKDLAKAVETAPDSITAMRIQGPEFEKNNLQIGMTAPDIEGRDLQGEPFKLSDYRGKVVVLDFWGDW